MSLKPWYKVVTPREDLREGKPLDASEFAVHLDQVRDKRAPRDYQDPERFFERTYLTNNLTLLASGVIRRLSGEKTETSAVYNMATQFGGGKTHGLTLLYHLARHGSEADKWTGVPWLLDKSGMKTVPKAATAVFVGTEFDSISGRGGDDGTPIRHTPWGEIAFQLADKEGLAVLAEHERQMTAPAGDVIRRFLPKDRPCLILMDELMNYVSRSRKSGMATQLYNFLQNLSEEARGRDNVVLAVSIPASELEMSAEDQSDYERFKKLLDRLGKAIVMSAETETSEIIRRRLFEWKGLPDEARKTVAEYGDWVIDHRQQIPTWFPVDHAREQFAATYPFHPSVLSVFERKWQALPRFQQTRGVLRLLALWVAKAFQEGFKGDRRDSLIGLGSAPLDDSMFRAALFEQLGEHRLEGAVTTDICGKKDSQAVRLDNEAAEAVKKDRLHRKAATAIFFESNGGMARGEATIPEIRMAVADPSLDIGNVEGVVEALAGSCYYLIVERNRYRFSFTPNLNKLLADRRANISPEKISERVRSEVQTVFSKGTGVERVYFPEKSSQVPDRAAITLVVVSPDQPTTDEKTTQWVASMTRESGSSNRTFKSALIWCLTEGWAALREDARKVLAWEDIRNDDTLRLDEGQERQLDVNVKTAQRDLRECVWRSYKSLLLLGKDNQLRHVDLGLVTSSAADSMTAFILSRLRQDGEITDGVSPQFLVRNWPPAFREWSTRAVRDAFFASPVFPRLLNADLIKDTIARGVSGGQLGYVGKSRPDEYSPFIYNTELISADVEVSEDMYVITKETAEAYKKAKERPIPPPTRDGAETSGAEQVVPEGERGGDPAPGGSTPPLKPPIVTAASFTKLSWSGEVPAQKWMAFYTKVISKFVGARGLRLEVRLDTAPDRDFSPQKVEEAKQALRDLGLSDKIQTN